MVTNLAADAAKVAPLASAAWYLNFVSEYGATIVTTLAIIYGILGVVLRVRELYTNWRDKRNGDSD